jgi:hypothetical protein
MRMTAKNVIRFAVPDGAAEAEVEIRLHPDRWGGWQTSLLLRPADGSPPLPLPRTFRAREHRLAAAKGVGWVRRRFEGARPIASLRRSL